LQGIGIQAGYRALDGETKDPIYETPEDGSGAGELIGYNTTPLYGVSDSSYSLVLSYERDKFDVRLSYVYRDDFLASNNRGFAQPALRYAASEESMDFQVSYDITDDWVVTFDATNLTRATGLILLTGTMVRASTVQPLLWVSDSLFKQVMR